MTRIRDTLAPLYENVKKKQNEVTRTVTLSLAKEQRYLFMAFWPHFLGQVIVELTEDPGTAQEHITILNQWPIQNTVKTCWHLFSGELSQAEQDGTIVSSLSQTLHCFLQGAPGHAFALAGKVEETLIPNPEVYQSQAQTWHSGERVNLGALIRWLAERSYERYETALEPGGFRVRGEQIDVWPPVEKVPYTITFYRSVLERITRQHGHRAEEVPRLTLWPAAFPKETIPLIKITSKATWLLPEPRPNLPNAIPYRALTPTLPFPFTLLDGKANLKARKMLVFCANHDRVMAALDARELANPALCHIDGDMPAFGLSSDTLNIVSEAWLLPQPQKERPVSYHEGLLLIAELTTGKPAVHADHGIGIYDGLQTRTFDDQSRDYLVVQYADGDSLSVPVEYAHKVTAYVGQETPPIGRLGGTSWKKTAARARHDAEAYAEELLALASKRAQASGHAYIIDNSLEDQLEASFPFALTTDQAKAWQDVQDDLVAPQPMDRLIVGDVGFGKTEVAVRAARHTVANGKQVAVLAPTTLLASQHTDTFTNRLPDIVDQLVTLSRFSTAAEQRVTREKISNGQTAIAIGTHALLAESITWKNLGLVIIDEEQRFGVSQKEHFKKLRSNVDILSLSATPIPRTLSMALANIKSLSVMSTAPEGRRSVSSVVGQISDEILREAAERELKRGGQLYVVAPKVRQLPSLAKTIQHLIPDASVAIAHGQLPSKQLADIMHQFNTGTLQILVSSSIIENGIDLPNANTIIVTRATHFGLSDLYQLRGRVGRRNRQGYAYFLYNQRELRGVQRQRLAALTEASRLGSGWSLAQRDLEIRGAGNMLGAEQSGTVSAVGVQLYLDLVQEALHRDSNTLVRRHDVDIQLPLSAVIPVHYIASANERTKAYQQLSRAQTDQLLQEAFIELTKRYGEAPPETVTLYNLVRLQHAAAAAGITSLKVKKISPPDEDPYDRLVIHAKDLPQVLGKLQGNTTSPGLGEASFEVRDGTLILDVDATTPSLVDQLIKALYS